MHKTLRSASLEGLEHALKSFGYVFYKSPHHYKRGKFHIEIRVHSETRCTLSLHRDRFVFMDSILGKHEAVWEGRDLREEMNKIINQVKVLSSRTRN